MFLKVFFRAYNLNMSPLQKKSYLALLIQLYYAIKEAQFELV